MSIFRFSLFISTVLLLTIIYDETERYALTPHVSKPDGCIVCHKNTSQIDDSHPIEIFGCAKCHGGNRFATNKKDAHKGVVLKPSRLEYAQRFCGDCHSKIVQRIEKSLMQTQGGILKVLRYQWQKASSPFSKEEMRDLSKNHFAKACASCHINQEESLFEEGYQKGGGCADCHRVSKKSYKDKTLIHPKFSTNIPSKNCLKCHNRSNRIGLSYLGIFESEGYGTPYKNGNFSHKLDNNRFYYNLPDDLHHKAGMECIDCHTEKGVMGDGKTHEHMEEAEDIKCKDCHKPHFKKADNLATLLSDLNPNIPQAKTVAYTNKKNSPIYNLQKEKDRAIFYRKRDGKKLLSSKMSDNPYHTLSIHKRLDCSACHTSWMPSCYGCHEVYFQNGKQFDWIKKETTKGKWLEFRSFLRFEKPSLGVGYNKKIMPFAPGCQVIGTIFKDKKVEKFHSLAMAGWNPHTTSKEVRECQECHFEPATLGLGRGNLDIKKGEILFTPFYNSKKSGMPFAYPIDAFVSKDGKEFQSTSRKSARSFNKKEIRKIIEAYRCIICHDSYNDKIYKDFNKSKKLFYGGKTKCLR